MVLVKSGIKNQKAIKLVVMLVVRVYVSTSFNPYSNHPFPQLDIIFLKVYFHVLVKKTDIYKFKRSTGTRQESYA